MSKKASAKPKKPSAVRTLWDLLPTRKPARKPAAKRPAKPPDPPHKTQTKAQLKKTTPPRPAARGGRMQARYDELTRRMLAAHGVRVRKWRTSMSGVAWLVPYTDGTEARLIEAPKPKGPMSCAIFLHEIGHHAIGLGRYRPRCLEEYHAWKFALDTMEAEGLNVTERVRTRVTLSLRYALSKGLRRGLTTIPAELLPYISGRPVPARKRAAAAGGDAPGPF